MTEFELLVIPLSLILGLGITNILSDVSDAIRDRERVPVHWIPFFWAFLIFMFQVQYFFVLWDQFELGVVWTWQRFGPALFNCVVLYLAAGLILPGRRNSDSANLLADFEKHGRLALKTLSLMLLVAVFLNTYSAVLDAPLLLAAVDIAPTADIVIWSLQQSSNVINYVLLASIGLVILSSKYSWQVAGTTIFAFAELFGLMAAWSEPGRTIF